MSNCILKHLFAALLGGMLFVPALHAVPPLLWEPGWSKQVDGIFSFGSPRTADMNGDGTEDILFGGGFENAVVNKIVCLDGTDGSVLWESPAANEIFGTPLLGDITGDSVPDVIINGRGAGLYAIDGSSGVRLWRYFDDPGDPIDYGLFNFYQPQWGPDMTGDGLPEILVANGGDRRISEEEPDRNFGYLMIIESSTGNAVWIDTLPDDQETYFNALLCDTDRDGQIELYYGTGGETDTGSLWVYRGPELVEPQRIDGPYPKGFIQPCLFADFTGDGRLDIASMNLDGRLKLIDGNGGSTVWSLSYPGYEFYGALSVCFLPGDAVPDLAFIASEGIFDSGYTHFRMLVADGATGILTVAGERGDFLQFNSPVSVDADGDGISELIYTANIQTGTGLYHQLLYTDLADLSTVILADSVYGHNFASTPFLSDTDGDGLLECIYMYNQPVDPPPLSLQTVLYHTDLPVSALVWPGYMGKGLKNVYDPGGITALDPETVAASLKVYPNPADELLYVERPASAERWRLLDTGGRSHAVQWQKEGVLDLSGLSSGTYWLSGWNRQGVFVARFVKQSP